MTPASDASAPQPPRPLIQRLGAILWPSFFAAGVATMLLFALVDPIDLAALTFPQRSVSRELGYTVAFLVFWFGYASACTTTWLLLQPTSRFNRPIDRQHNRQNNRQTNRPSKRRNPR
ncbi:MAG: hypothetical protein AAGH65_00280 [Pseudomonadota bacterium]